MNKILLYSFFIIILVETTYAQKQFLGIVDYDLIINNPDGTTFANPFKLYFNSNVSFYEKIGPPKRLINKTGDNTTDSEGRMVSHKRIINNLPKPFCYSNVNTKELIFRENVISKTYFIMDTIEPIPWKLEQDHKKIGDYSCQKAIATYRGRVYTVWFTTEIPVSHGPWKLRGLPGLILEVTEETGKYEFKANTIVLHPDNTVLKEKLKKPGIKGISTMDIYIDAIKNKYENTMALARASLPRGAKLMTDCDTCPDPKNYSLERFD